MNFVVDERTLRRYRTWEFESGHKVTSDRQKQAIVSLLSAGTAGLTARELAQQMNPSDVSGVNGWGSPLTLLRQQGVVVALEDQRQSHHVYVLPEYAGDRPTWPGYRHRGHCATCTCDGAQ